MQNVRLPNTGRRESCVRNALHQHFRLTPGVQMLPQQAGSFSRVTQIKCHQHDCSHWKALLHDIKHCIVSLCANYNNIIVLKYNKQTVNLSLSSFKDFNLVWIWRSSALSGGSVSSVPAYFLGVTKCFFCCHHHGTKTWVFIGQQAWRGVKLQNLFQRQQDVTWTWLWLTVYNPYCKYRQYFDTKYQTECSL